MSDSAEEADPMPYSGPLSLPAQVIQLGPLADHQMAYALRQAGDCLEYDAHSFPADEPPDAHDEEIFGRRTERASHRRLARLRGEYRRVDAVVDYFHTAVVALLHLLGVVPARRDPVQDRAAKEPVADEKIGAARTEYGLRAQSAPARLPQDREIE